MKTLLALLCSLMIAATGLAQSGTAGERSGNPETKYGASDSADAKAAETKSADATDDTTKPPRKAPVRIVLPSKSEEKAVTKKTEPAKKAEPAKKEEPKMKGVIVPRGEKGFLGVEIVGGAFKINFYDSKKKPKEPDVIRAALRWDPKYKVGQERIILNPDGDGKSLSNPRSIRPPYNFKLFITLIKEPTEKEDPVGETHVIDFKG